VETHDRADRPRHTRVTAANEAPHAHRLIDLDRPLDLLLTLRPLWRGSGDPTMRLGLGRAWRATRTADGPATLSIAVHDGRVTADAWGPGARLALDALPALLGQDDDRAGWDPAIHPAIAALDRRLPGVRLGRTGAVMEALVPAIIEQKVTGREAFASFRGLVRALGEPAPGPLGLRLPPDAARLAGLPYHAFHPLGIERRRADTIRAAAARGSWLEATATLLPAEAVARLRSIPGVGPWTAAEVAVRALGDRDAVSVGDYHLPHLVGWVLAGEPRADDDRMLELLEPFRGQRARVVRLVEASGLGPPRRGPRMPVRSIAGI
jgi:3-methyladenine DNA glycosylase/8-oxoguanine DNA glycosylase